MSQGVEKNLFRNPPATFDPATPAHRAAINGRFDGEEIFYLTVIVGRGNSQRDGCSLNSK